MLAEASEVDVDQPDADRYSTWSRLWSLLCSRLFYFRLSSSNCTVPGVLSLKLLQAYLDDVHFQAPGRLFACRGPRQFMHTPV